MSGTRDACRPAWPFARVIAHRGGGTLAPENTIGAIRVGLGYGFRAIEIDAMLPRDDVPILMHDPVLGRTVRGRGAITDFTAAELVQRDAGAWHSPRFVGEPIPRLADVLAFCRGEGVWINVEIKPAPGREADTGRVVARLVAEAYRDLLHADGAIQDTVAPAVPLLSSFSTVALESARAAAPALPRGWLVDRLPADWRAQYDALGAVAVHVNHRHLTEARCADIKSAGAWLFCYTVNDPARARMLLEWGVDAFCTDRIDLIGADFVSAG